MVAIQRQLINTARGKFDVIILDTAPVLWPTTPVEVMPDVDLVVVVARAEISRTPAAHRAMDMLLRVDAPLVGLVLNASQERRNEYYAYYQPRSGATTGRKNRANGTNGAASGEAVETESGLNTPL